MNESFVGASPQQKEDFLQMVNEKEAFVENLAEEVVQRHVRPWKWFTRIDASMLHGVVREDRAYMEDEAEPQPPLIASWNQGTYALGAEKRTAKKLAAVQNEIEEAKHHFAPIEQGQYLLCRVVHKDGTFSWMIGEAKKQYKKKPRKEGRSTYVDVLWMRVLDRKGNEMPPNNFNGKVVKFLTGEQGKGPGTAAIREENKIIRDSISYIGIKLIKDNKRLYLKSKTDIALLGIGFTLTNDGNDTLEYTDDTVVDESTASEAVEL